MVSRISKKLATVWLPAIALVVTTFPVFADSHMKGGAAEPEPDAQIEIKQWKVGFILGGGGGEGTLIYQGKSYPLKIDGLRVGALAGIAKTDLTGSVFNLTKLEDIEGTYTAGEAAIAIAGGGKAWALKNSKGVVLKLSGKQLGIEVALDVAGMSVKLEDT